MSMVNPPHPGRILKKIVNARYSSITEFADYINMSRISVSRVLNQRACVSIDMAFKLQKAELIDARHILRMQQAYDIAQYLKGVPE